MPEILEPHHLSMNNKWNIVQNAITIISLLEQTYDNKLYFENYKFKNLKVGQKRNYHNFFYERGMFLSQDEFYRENIDNPDIIVRNLSQCNCCETHKKNRPKYIADWASICMPAKCDREYKSCKCPCRHYSRMICRACCLSMNETPLWIPENQEINNNN